jgi:hypothetical protein
VRLRGLAGSLDRNDRSGQELASGSLAMSTKALGLWSMRWIMRTGVYSKERPAWPIVMKVKLALHVCVRVGYKKDWCVASFVWPNSRRAAARFMKPPFSVLLPPRKQAKPCRCILSTIDTTPSCCRSYLPLHHISLDREGGVVGAMYVCISRRRRHLRHWIGSDREEKKASTTTSSTFCWTFPLCDFFKRMKISSISLVDYIS